MKVQAMDETYLLTVEFVGQAGEDLLIAPSLPADKYWFHDPNRIKIVKPDGQVIETDAEFTIPFSRPPSFRWSILIPKMQKNNVPIGSQIWITKSLEQITREPDTTEE
jgi:hypothetical protein